MKTQLNENALMKTMDKQINGCKGTSANVFTGQPNVHDTVLRWWRSAGVVVLSLGLLFMMSCTEETTPTFRDNYSTLYTFLEDNEEVSLFKAIVDAAIIPNTSQSMKSVYSSYNSNNGNNQYTLMLPDNEAIEKYLAELGLSFEQLTASAQDCWDLAANHLLNLELYSRDFPNGEIPDSSLNGEKHTIRYEESDNGVIYYIDEIASVKIPDFVVSNGIVHIIDNVLIPITYTSGDWLKSKSEYSIFFDALQITGFYDRLQELDPLTSPLTMFVESNLVFQKSGIYSIDDLKQKLSPAKTNYTEDTNPLYQFIAYHLLQDKALYISDMTDGRSNQGTYISYPLPITLSPDLSLYDGLSKGIALNDGFKVLDTLVSVTGDTTFLDYVSLYESKSNRPTTSGVMHFVNHMLEVSTKITTAITDFDFTEDPAILNAQGETVNVYYSFKDEDLERFDFGGELEFITYFRNDDDGENARNKDYIMFGGLYELSYRTTRIVQGDYNLQLRLDATRINGLVDVYLDGKKVGATINLSAQVPPNNNNPYRILSVSNVQIEGYKEHVLTLKAITPGFVVWDYIRFSPISN